MRCRLSRLLRARHQELFLGIENWKGDHDVFVDGKECVGLRDLRFPRFGSLRRWTQISEGDLGQFEVGWTWVNKADVVVG